MGGCAEIILLHQIQRDYTTERSMTGLGHQGERLNVRYRLPDKHRISRSGLYSDHLNPYCFEAGYIN